MFVRRKIVNYFHVLQKIKVYYYTYLCLTFFFMPRYCAYQIMFPNKNKLRKKYNDICTIVSVLERTKGSTDY